MAKQHVTEDVAAVIAEEVAAIEAGRDAPIPESAKISRGNGRSKILQVRLNPDELDELEQLEQMIAEAKQRALKRTPATRKRRRN